MNTLTVIVRPFEERDRDAIRYICSQTGQRGNPASVYFGDDEILPMLYADYYMEFEPEACFVTEAEGRVVGYLLGCKDTSRYDRHVLTRIFPRVCLRVIWRLLTLQYREKQTYQAMWWGLTRGWRETLRPPVAKYPAHCHANVIAEYRTQGIGQRLYHAFHTHLVETGIRGTHAITIEAENDERLSGHLRQNHGYTLQAVKRHTLWERATGQKWYTKLLVREIAVRPDRDQDTNNGG